MTSKGDPRHHRARRGAAGERVPATGTSDLSCIVEVDEVPEGGLPVAVRADAAERAAVAKNAGLIAVESLEADLDIAKQGAAKFKVSGPLKARIAQTCVVSLDPFESEITPRSPRIMRVRPGRSLPRRSRPARDAALETEAVDDLVAILRGAA